MSVILLRGDARELPLPDESVDLIVTSPPFWNQRDYRDGSESLAGQIGTEMTPQEYVAALLECTREWCRALKPAGSIFVNLGDKFAGSWGGSDPKNPARINGHGRRGSIPAKSLIGLPERYMIGCIDELGLIVRRDNIWHKLNPTPESADDRCATSHEYVYHLVKQPRYYSAVDEIREAPSDYARPNNVARATPPGVKPKTFADTVNPLGKLPGSVWAIASQPLKVPATFGLRHYAAWPMAVPRQIILGWSPPGICTECGDGRQPVVSSLRTVDGLPVGGTWQTEAHGHALGPQGVGHWRYATERHRLGYACSCTPFTDHPERRGKDFHAGTDRAVQGMNDGNGGERYRRYVDEMANPRGPVREYHFDRWIPAPMRPAIVLDPFGGTGCTALVADVLGRTGISVDLSMDYARIARWRTGDPGERARALQVPKPPPVPDGQESLFDLEAS